MTLERLETALRADDRVGGVLLVGSGAYGFYDELSDLDLAVVVQRNVDALTIFKDWHSKLHSVLPILWCFTDIRGPEVGLYAVILSDFMEVDISFQSLTALSARSPNWRILFDRTGEVERIMGGVSEDGTRVELQERYLRRLDSIWHYVTHVAILIKRGQMWRALHYLEELRNRTIEIECLLSGCRTGHFREVDRLPSDRLAALERTLVGSTHPDDVVRALKAATQCFFETAARVEQECGLNKAEKLRNAMEEYLQIIGF